MGGPVKETIEEIFSLDDEEQDQFALVAWLVIKKIRHHATPNGGLRDKKTAVRLKKGGVVPGVPDITIWPEVGSGLPILWIELKRKSGGRTYDEQKEWIEYLNSIGQKHDIKAVVCNGCMEAIDFIQAEGY